jgi:vitellogenic carboxypeptidase-like protein
MFGLFVEHGPWYVTPNLTLADRKHAWTSNYSVLYIDSPVGTGWSYTDNRTECYAHNEQDVARDLLTFLKAFFAVFYKLKSNPFFITGNYTEFFNY